MKEPFGDIKKFSWEKKRKMIILNSLIELKNMKGTLYDFLTFILLQNIQKLKEDPLETSKKFQKNRRKKSQCRKKWKGEACFGMICFLC